MLTHQQVKLSQIARPIDPYPGIVGSNPGTWWKLYDLLSATDDIQVM